MPEGASTSYPSGAQRPEVAAVAPAVIGRPSQVPAGQLAPGPAPEIQYWQQCIQDAERAEQNWRKRGVEIVQLYRNETTSTRAGRIAWNQGVYYNILYANTEVMLPAIYMKPPEPVVRSRFTNLKPPPPPMPPMPPAPPGVMPADAMPGGPSMPPGMPPPAVAPLGPPSPPLQALPPMPPPLPGVGGPLQNAPLGPQLAAQSGPMGGLANLAPDPADIDTAAAVIEKALEIIVDDEHSHEAIKASIKDMLLPGRGVCRVRWKPQMRDVPVTGADGAPLLNPETNEPQTEQRKVWEEVDDEYVYWQDFLCDPVRQAADMQWMAFRHLFDEKQLLAEFTGSEPFDTLVSTGNVRQLLKWTRESAAKSPPGGGTGMKSAQNLGDYRRFAMLWEIWDKKNRRVLWFCPDATGMILRVDPDVLRLAGFFPCPVPMLAVTSSDTRIPRPYYDLYQDLAADLNSVSVRISRLTEQVKVRGAYNGASTDIADLLKAGDGKMIPVDGVDLMSGGLANHIWLMPIAEFMAALDKLYLAREQLKASIYEIMGISDIMRGATKASETATAQRIKGSMSIVRLEDVKQQTGNFVRDLLRLKAEVICQNFDAETLSAMTGENVTPAVMAILRSDFQRTCSIDIEADSTIAVDEAAEQQAMTMVMQSIQGVMQGAQAMLMSGVLPPQQVIQLSLEMMKMLLHPVRYSRSVVDLINQFQDQLAAAPLLPPPMPMAPPGAAPPEKPAKLNGAPPGAASLPPGPAGPAAAIPQLNALAA